MTKRVRSEAKCQCQSCPAVSNFCGKYSPGYRVLLSFSTTTKKTENTNTANNRPPEAISVELTKQYLQIQRMQEIFVLCRMQKARIPSLQWPNTK
jgi:hypothetical protein